MLLLCLFSVFTLAFCAPTDVLAASSPVNAIAPFGSTQLSKRCSAEGSAALDAIAGDVLQIAADINKICNNIESKMLGEQALGENFITECEFIVKAIINAGEKCFQLDLTCLLTEGVSKFVSIFSQLLLCVMEFLGGLFRFVLVMGSKLLIPSGQWGAGMGIPKIVIDLVGKLFGGLPSLQNSLGGLLGQTLGMFGSTTQQCLSLNCTPDVNATLPMVSKAFV